MTASAEGITSVGRVRPLRWVALALLVIAALIGLWGRRLIPRPSALPHTQPDPSILVKFPKVRTGWDSPTPYWFLGNLTPPHRFEVGLSTGQFWHTQTDIYIGDTIPLVLTRTYLSRDSRSRAFGVGTTDSLDIFLVGNSHPFTYLELIMPNGRRIYYHRVNPGTGYKDAVYRHDAGPGEERTIFAASTIGWDVNRWDLRLGDGTILIFPDSGGKTLPGQAALLQVTTPNGQTLTIIRDELGNVLRVNSPNGAWMTLTHDSDNRITQAVDSNGHLLTYSYDGKGRLESVQDPAHGVTHYGYGDKGLLASVMKPDGTLWLENTFDSEGRLTSDSIYARKTSYRYHADEKGQITATEIFHYDGGIDRYDWDTNGVALKYTQERKAPAGSPTVSSQKQL
jgi:YD repeat-containing protein